ncbi:hypothetical protein T03_4894 [Trichinella britovi]|uniref:Uncharacterized protein n=1 Tax=Trichinella britovi TaxID=45882 RepID=A0A0V1CHH3_TRIBR|nr:hypothetical protein T03_4894 [Trichinella britovi]
MEPNKKYFNIRNSSIEFYCNVLKKGVLLISTSGQLDFIFYVDILLAVSLNGTKRVQNGCSKTSRKTDTHQQPENVDYAKLNKYSNAARWMQGLRFDWMKN